jgi:hypothetical protein
MNNNLPLAQWAAGHERMMQVKLKSSSDRVFATNLMLEFFTMEELIAPNVNVLGRVQRGNEGNQENTRSLDVNTVSNIKRIVISYVEGDMNVKRAVWKNCVTAMNQKMAVLRRNNNNNNNNN